MDGGRDPFFGFGGPFPSFGGFGSNRSLIPNFFGGSDPFNDPFFTTPFGNMFDSSLFGPPSRSPFESSFFGPGRSPFMDAHASGFLEHQPSQPSRSRGPIIEELDSDDEQGEKEDTEEKKSNPRKHGRSSKQPFVQDPDDEAEDRRSKQMQFRNNFNGVNNMQSQPQAHSFTFQSSSVTYGGANGPFYTSSTTRRSGSDGLTFEESKEANSATRQAKHRIARGIQNKGHSVTRKLNSDGKVDTMQTLHNLHEAELANFEETWKGNAGKHLPGWSNGVNAHGSIGSGTSAPNRPGRGGWALPSAEGSNESGSMRPEMTLIEDRPHPHHPVRSKTDGGDKMGSSSGVGRRASDMGNMDRVRRR